jgi:hypothetical protein
MVGRRSPKIRDPHRAPSRHRFCFMTSLFAACLLPAPRLVTIVTSREGRREISTSSSPTAVYFLPRFIREGHHDRSVGSVRHRERYVPTNTPSSLKTTKVPRSPSSRPRTMCAAKGTSPTCRSVLFPATSSPSLPRPWKPAPPPSASPPPASAPEPPHDRSQSHGVGEIGVMRESILGIALKNDFLVGLRRVP